VKEHGSPTADIPLAPALLNVAAAAIDRANRGGPADAALRAELKCHRDLAPESARAISRAVFAYYRWRKWLGDRSTHEQLAQAVQLQKRFSTHPSSFTPDELRANAVPDWIAQEVAVSAGWLRALQSEPKIWLRAKPGHAADLARKLGAVAKAGSLPETLEYGGTTDLFRTEEFHAGEFEIQDISSQIVSVLCAPNAGETWWDACAGEGGKTLHLSDLMHNQGLIWASDRAAWRLQKLKRRAARAKIFNYRISPWPGGAKLPTKTRFNGVLVDAPCSGVGTWQRNPDARWTTTPQDVLELSQLQGQLLARAAPAVKPGGKLVYAVCTLTQAETVKVAAEFERQFPGFQPLPLVNPLQPNATSSAPLWIWPQDCDGNGMFIAAWRKELQP